MKISAGIKSRGKKPVYKTFNQPINDNCLTLIRYIAAINVLYGHIITHLHISMPMFITRIIAAFEGVPIFFVLSGFLIWNSLSKDMNFKTYLKKRFMRIFPELWIIVAIELITIVIFDFKEIKWSSLGLFAITQSTVIQFWTPGSLSTFGCGVPNGSLWTITVIVQFYILIYFIRLLTQKIEIKKVVNTALVISLVLGFMTPYIEALFPVLIFKLYKQTVIPYLWLFMIGVYIMDNYNAIIPSLKKYWPLFILISFITGNFGFDIVLSYKLLKSLFLVLFVIGFAYSYPKINIKKDISYEMYLCHMIVVNIFIELGLINNVMYMVLVIAFTFVIANFCNILQSNLINSLRRK